MGTAGPKEAAPTHHGLQVILVIQHRERIIVNPEENRAVQVVVVSGQRVQAVLKEHRDPVDNLHHPTMVVMETVEAARTEVGIIRCCLTARVPAYQLILAQHKTMEAVITGPSEPTGMNSKTQQQTTATTSHFTA